jgi:D-glycero-alpha-D-manno-heptose 1-phosphate guanylyltransferase
MKLLVLAGGFGTRLQSVVAKVPKALAPVGNVPFLRLQIEHWKNQGIDSFVFLLHHQAELIISFLQKEQRAGVLKDCEVHWVVEPTPMDTGGAVAYALDQHHLTGTGDFLLTNADTWLGGGIANLRQVKAPAMAVVELGDATRYGCVQFDKQHHVTAFREKNNHQGAGWINAGLCHLNADSFQDCDGLPFSLERLTFPAMVSKGMLQAVTLQTNFIDIGIPNDYLTFCRWIAADRQGDLCS